MRIARRLAPLVLAGALTACGSDGGLSKVDPRYGVKPSPRVAAGESVRKGGGRYHVGKPYKIAGKWYHPKEEPNYRASGKASWYGEAFHGRLTANGEVFDMLGLSAAHPTLPLPSYVRVTNRANGHAVVVRVNDRGPFHGRRIIDVSRAAAKVLGFKGAGTADVSVEYVDKARMDGEDDWLVGTATIRGEKMSRRQLADLGVNRRLLRAAAGGDATRIATADPATSPVLASAAPTIPVSSAGQPAISSTPSLRAYSDVLVGAFSDQDSARYVAGVLGQFGEVKMQSVSIGGQVLQHMTLRSLDPDVATAAVSAARGLGATDAQVVPVGPVVGTPQAW